MRHWSRAGSSRSWTSSPTPEKAGRPPAQAAFLSLFTYLSSGSRVRTPAELHGWLREAGFTGQPRKVRTLRIPGQALYTARVAGGAGPGGARS